MDNDKNCFTEKFYFIVNIFVKSFFSVKYFEYFDNAPFYEVRLIRQKQVSTGRRILKNVGRIENKLAQPVR